MHHPASELTMRQTRVLIWMALAGASLLQGCAANGPLNRSQVGDTTEVRIQFCLPTKIVKFDDLTLDHLENHPTYTHYSSEQLARAPRTIRRVVRSDDAGAIDRLFLTYSEVLKQDGLFSEIGGSVALSDATVADQPVFERGYTRPAGDYVAFSVLGPDPRPGVTVQVRYWYVLPKNIAAGTFSAWLPPVSMEPADRQDGTDWTLLRGGTLLAVPVVGAVPRMRVSFAKLPLANRNPATDTLPALTTARRHLRVAESKQDFVHEFVEKSSATIPACR